MKKVQFLLLFACVAGNTALASSNPKVDSLLRILESDAPGDRVEVLWGIAYELFDVDNPEALFYAARAYKEVWAGGDSLQIVKVGTTYGQLLRRLDQVNESIAVSSRMLPIAKRHNYRKYRKMLLNSLALTHMFIDNTDLALSYHLESLALRQEDGNMKEIGVTLANIGIVQFELGDYDLAIEYSRRSIEIYLSTNDLSSLSQPFVNIGFSFIGLKQYEKAMESFQASMKFSKVCSDQNIGVEIEFGCARSFFLTGDLDSAKHHSTKSLAIAERIKGQRFQIWNLVLLARIEMLRGEMFRCDSYLSRAESMPALLDYPAIVLEVQKQRALYFSKIGEFQKAFQEILRRDSLYDCTFSQELAKRVRAVHTRYAQQENILKIESQGQILELQDDAIIRQRWLIILGTVVLVLTIIVVLVLYQSNSRKKKVNLLLDERVRERTIELGHQRDVLQHAYDEQTLIRKRMSEEIIALTATLKGLFYLSRRELPFEYGTYFKQAEATTDKIVQAIDHFRSLGERTT